MTDSPMPIKYVAEREGHSPIYACGNCKRALRDFAAATACCACECGKTKVSGMAVCASCLGERRAFREERAKSKAGALPAVEYGGGPVFCRDSYFSGLGECLEHLEGVVELPAEEMAEEIIHPCLVRKPFIPDLAEFVESCIADNFDDCESASLSAKDCKALEEAVASLALPDVWVPRREVRLLRSWAGESQASA